MHKPDDDNLAPAIEAGQEDGHVEKARRAIHMLHAAHDEAATPMDRLVDGATGILGRPAALIAAVLIIAAWIVANQLMGIRALDRFPFPDLELAISAVALAIALLILATQRRADKLADARERMTLELSLQSAQKVSKVIALLEELRRDSPNVPDRPDPEAKEMSSRRAETEVLEQTPAPAKE
jgi:uncharacterized membrane protein